MNRSVATKLAKFSKKSTASADVPFLFHQYAKVAQKLLSATNEMMTPNPQHTLAGYWLLSATDGESRAKTVVLHTTSLSPQHIAEQLVVVEKKFDKPLKWFRLEWVVSSKAYTWKLLQEELKGYKRNYFRSGIAFVGKREPWLLCSEMEINAHACLYQGVEVSVAQVNMKNLQAYLKARHGSSQMPDFADEMPVMTFMTDGVFYDADLDQVHQLSSLSRQHGRRKMPPLDADNSQEIIKNLTAYLGKQVKSDGIFEYGHFPVFGRTIDTYNTLRHFSSIYALIEGYEFCRTHKLVSLPEIAQQIDKALRYAVEHFIRHYDQGRAYVLEINNEIKLGANSVAILALVKYLQVFDTELDENKKSEYQALAEALACGIAAMQQDNGGFVHILDGSNLSVLAESRVIYYDGEAAFGLMRLYGLTKDARWLQIVKRAFDYFINAGHSQAHDHWLSYCSNELVQHYPEEKYFQFAVDNVKGYTNFIQNRITTFPTLLELSMAFHKMLLKLDEFPQFAHVLDGFDVADFYQALHARANYLLNGIFFPEMAMFYKKPESIVWGGFIRHHAFRVRIDDVEHYLSGLVAYHQLLQSGVYPKSSSRTDKSAVTEFSPLTVNGVLQATGGYWSVVPQDDWQATGVAIHPAGFKAGCLLVVRAKDGQKGFLPAVAVKSFVLKGAAGIITDDPETYQDFGVPVLVVKNVRQSVIDLGLWARKHFSGRVIGITGSAGKTTTVAMMSGALSQVASVGQTLGSANLPIGVAWNMASLLSNDKYWVLELAIGDMANNSKLARPDIALITNIAPAHLEYHNDVKTIALKKSRIFSAMSPNSYAVICRDIEHYDLIVEQAKAYGLQVVSYGESVDADNQLVSYQQGDAKFRIGQNVVNAQFKAQGRHIALNALAVLTVASIEGISLDVVIEKLAQFEAVEGRGNVSVRDFDGKQITVYDESYNANPLSMAAALNAFGDTAIAHDKKLLIIGDMLELGGDSEQYHRAVIEYIAHLPIQRVILVGDQMCKHASWLAEQKNSVYTAKDKNEALVHLKHIVQDGDYILFKASNGVGLHNLIK